MWIILFLVTLAIALVCAAGWGVTFGKLREYRDPLERERRAILAAANAEADRLLANAREQALKIVDDLQRDAQAEAQRVVDHALALDES